MDKCEFIEKTAYLWIAFLSSHQQAGELAVYSQYLFHQCQIMTRLPVWKNLGGKSSVEEKGKKLLVGCFLMTGELTIEP